MTLFSTPSSINYPNSPAESRERHNARKEDSLFGDRETHSSRRLRDMSEA